MLRIGVLGGGEAGLLYLGHWSTIPGVSIAGFFEPDEAAARELMQGIAIPRFTDPASLVEASDALHICLSPDARNGFCEMAVRQGKHLFISLPMASTPEEALQLVDLVKEAGVKCQPGYFGRFHPALQLVKDLPGPPACIELLREIPLAEYNPAIHIVTDHMIHDVDCILSIAKSDIKSVSANGSPVLAEGPDIVNARIEFLNGTVANISCNRTGWRKQHTLKLYGKEWALAIDLETNQAEQLSLEETALQPVYTQAFHTHSGTRQLFVTTPSFAAADPVRLALESFVHAVLQNTRTQVTERDGLLAMEITRQVLEKAAHNHKEH